jgi:hypothetical protein
MDAAFPAKAVLLHPIATCHIIQRAIGIHAFKSPIRTLLMCMR